MCVSGLYHLFSVPLILLTNTYISFGRPTLNFVERFWLWLGSVRSASKITQMNWKELISQLQMHSQVNSQVNCIAMYKCTQMFSENESQKLGNLKSKPERSLRRIRENLIAISLHVTKSINIVFTHYVKLSCILCLCIILLVKSKSHSVEFLCWYYRLLSGCHEDRRVNRRNYLKFISKFWT